MRISWFIARRLIGQRSYKSGASGPIITIGITAIALGIIAMLVALGTGVGLKQEIGEKVAAFSGHIRVTTLENSQRQETLKPLENAAAISRVLKQHNKVTSVQAVAYVPGVLLNNQAFDGVVFKGVDASFNKDFFTFFGTSNTAQTLGKQDVWISSELAKKLALELGDRVPVYFASDKTSFPKRRTCTIAGIFNTGFSDYDDTYIIGHIDVVRSLYQWEDDQVGAFELFVRDGTDLTLQSDAIYDSIDSLVDVQHIQEQFPEIFNWIRLFSTNISLIIIIMIIVGGVNMITALLVLILEQTHLIGVTRVMGAQVRTVQQLFLIQGAYLIGVGLFWGNLIGLGLLYLQKQTGFITLDPETYYVKNVPIFMDLQTVLWLNGLTLFVCFILLLLPSLIISKISPTQALKINP